MRLNCKAIKIGLKNHYSVKDFAEHYEISEEEVLFEIDQIYSTDQKSAEKIKKDLKDNAKKAISKKGKVATTKAEISDTTENVSNASVETVASIDCVVNSGETFSTEITIENDEEKQLSVDSLAFLLEYEAAIRNDLYSAEISHKELITKKSAQIDKLRELRDQLSYYRDQLEKTKSSIDAIISEYTTTIDNISDVNATLRSLRDELEKNQRNIEEVKKLPATIFIYANSTIEIENYIAELPEADSEMFQQFSVDERFEDLTLKELRQLCKLIAFVTILKNDGKQFECIFDHKKLETAYNSLTF